VEWFRNLQIYRFYTPVEYEEKDREIVGEKRKRQEGLSKVVSDNSERILPSP
jgi:hypothetical protein